MLKNEFQGCLKRYSHQNFRCRPTIVGAKFLILCRQSLLTSHQSLSGKREIMYLPKAYYSNKPEFTQSCWFALYARNIRIYPTKKIEYLCPQAT